MNHWCLLVHVQTVAAQPAVGVPCLIWVWVLLLNFLFLCSWGSSGAKFHQPAKQFLGAPLQISWQKWLIFEWYQGKESHVFTPLRANQWKSRKTHEGVVHYQWCSSDHEDSMVSFITKRKLEVCKFCYDFVLCLLPVCWWQNIFSLQAFAVLLHYLCKHFILLNSLRLDNKLHLVDDALSLMWELLNLWCTPSHTLIWIFSPNSTIVLLMLQVFGLKYTILQYQFASRTEIHCF